MDKILIVLFLIATSTYAIAQSRNYDVWIKPKGQYDIKVTLKQLKADTIIFDFKHFGTSIVDQQIEFSEISEINYRKKHQVTAGRIFGGLIGIGSGLLIGNATSRCFLDSNCAITKSMMVAGLGVLGMIIGGSIAGDRMLLKFSGNGDEIQRQKEKLKKELFSSY